MIWGLLKTAIWFGVMFAVLTVIVAGSLVLIVGAVAVGCALPSRTVRGQLRSLIANVEASVAHVRALGSRG